MRITQKESALVGQHSNNQELIGILLMEKGPSAHKKKKALNHMVVDIV